MYVDFVVKFQSQKSADKSGGFPFEAVQVKTAKYYTEPPFSLSAEFKSAFKTALKASRPMGVIDLLVTKPPAALIRSIYANLTRYHFKGGLAQSASPAAH
jgi:hypothetical protein